MSRKVCFYVMRSDTGFAPNPYFGVCTLAVCTPNHMSAQLVPNDYIVGCFRTGEPERFVYCMKVDRVLTLDAYYRDPVYRHKKPSVRHLNGDNIYHRDAKGRYQQHRRAWAHNTNTVDDMRARSGDIRGDRVFIGAEFVYLGRDSVLLDTRFVPCLNTQGIKYLTENENQQLFSDFLLWRQELGQGKLADPRDYSGPDPETGKAGRSGCQPSPPRSCRK